jgi:hypothetical protein
MRYHLWGLRKYDYRAYFSRSVCSQTGRQFGGGVDIGIAGGSSHYYARHGIPGALVCPARTERITNPHKPQPLFPPRWLPSVECLVELIADCRQLLRLLSRGRPAVIPSKHPHPEAQDHGRQGPVTSDHLVTQLRHLLSESTSPQTVTVSYQMQGSVGNQRCLQHAT